MRPPSSSLTVTITPEEQAPLLASARALASVKLDSIEHTERRLREGLELSADLHAHAAELVEIEEVIQELERGALGRAHDLTVRRALLDELVASALIAESQDLADCCAALQSSSEPGDITAWLHVLHRLVATLANVRA